MDPVAGEPPLLKGVTGGSDRRDWHFLSFHFLEKQMTESNKLTVLRDKLVRRRRAIVESIQSSTIDRLGGEDIARIQNEIEAVDKAIAEEKLAEFQV
jgi:hypothetical protein